MIDWRHPPNNDFLPVSQFGITGALYTCRPDLVGFLNALALLVVELKNPGVPARAAFDEILAHYRHLAGIMRRCVSERSTGKMPAAP